MLVNKRNLGSLFPFRTGCSYRRHSRGRPTSSSTYMTVYCVPLNLPKEFHRFRLLHNFCARVRTDLG